MNKKEEGLERGKEKDGAGKLVGSTGLGISNHAGNTAGSRK